MPFIPHTASDLSEMLAAIGVSDLDALFDEIPPALHNRSQGHLPPALSEMALSRLMSERADRDRGVLSFLGAGAYEHHIPAPVWEIAGRGEFYSAYTPYQAEASQGILQVLYEYQSMMAGLTGLDASNASLYDGASALGEAVLMGIRANRQVKNGLVLIPASVHPHYRQVVFTLTHYQGITVRELPFDPLTGQISTTSLAEFSKGEVAVLVIPQPNFFGVLEEADDLTDWAHEIGAVVVGLVNPVSLGLLKPPGEWGKKGADIACGEGQPLGAPLSSGGPYFGFLTCRKAHLRQMPGRIIGRTRDREGKSGFVLTLQAREQHIRRSKATSNICTNQGLMTVAAAIHLSILGPDGLGQVAAACIANTRALVEKLSAIPGVKPLFDAPFFHEAVLTLETPLTMEGVLDELAQKGIAGGYPLQTTYPALAGELLVCATETKTPEDIDHFARALGQVLNAAAGEGGEG
ncbi:MAG: aminomethyl-transferring glycine dehydrogenase subunit GcvPA [Magnetococcales bacterium]|nr:aminomethyl-transferring glycine dehydrogenase subunit GcvPA [Magnetococcales bacterium]